MISLGTLHRLSGHVHYAEGDELTDHMSPTEKVQASCAICRTCDQVAFVYNHAHEDGWQEGYQVGYDDGYSDSESDHEEE